MKRIRQYFPKTFDFFSDFFEAMNNKPTGHSLRKWLAVGFYWIMFKISLDFTTAENIVLVLGVHGGMVTTLIITYTVGNNADQKLKQKQQPENKVEDEQQN